MRFIKRAPADLCRQNILESEIYFGEEKPLNFVFKILHPSVTGSTFTIRRLKQLSLRTITSPGISTGL